MNPYSTRIQGREMLKERLIGKFEIQYDGKPVVVPSRAAQSLFAYLILTAGTLHRMAGSIPGWIQRSCFRAKTGT
jgi:hypothetical protein